MSHSHNLTFASLAVLLLASTSSQAQTARAGQQCVPAVGNPQDYGNCRLRIVAGDEICRCAITPQARRTGSINQFDQGQRQGFGFIGTPTRNGVIVGGQPSRGGAVVGGTPSSG